MHGGDRRPSRGPGRRFRLTALPRWLPWLLAAFVAAILWRCGHLAHAPEAATAIGSSASVHCQLPPPFTEADSPLQSPVDDRMPSFRLGQAKVTPLAGFSLEARVLSREDYWLDAESNYSPTDLALGWGAMANPEVYKSLSISQGGRRYRYEWDASAPIPPVEMARHSANMHQIPADAEAARELARVRADDTIRLQGWLVEIDRDDGWRWRSSTTRDDTGDGACELIYVCRIQTR